MELRESHRPDHYHYYQDIVGWFDFHYPYSLGVELSESPGLILEVGPANGRSTAYLAVEIANSGKEIELHTVDIFTLHNGYEYVKGHLAKFPFVKVWKMSSEQYFDQVAKELKYDMIWFDGDHSYETVKYEVNSYLPLLKPGGLMGGHDYYNGGTAGERRAVREFFTAHPHLTPCISYISWYFINGQLTVNKSK